MKWRVEDIRICLDCDPDATRGPARVLRQALEELESRGWHPQAILNVGGADLGEAVILICATKDKSPAVTSDKKRPRKPRIERKNPDSKPSDPERDDRLALLAEAIEHLAKKESPK